VHKAVKVAQYLGDDFFAGYAIPSTTMIEKRPVVETLLRISKYVKLILNEFDTIK